MGYPHYSNECHEFHDLVCDFGSVEDSDRPQIVCLCGSTTFKDDFARVAAELTLDGKIVVKPDVFGHIDMPEEDWTTGRTNMKRQLDALHRRKIDLADYIFVINPGGYIGESTASEIDYAELTGKPVRYIEEPA